MDGEGWIARADEDAYVRLTAIGLLVEAAGCVVLALIILLFGGLSSFAGIAVTLIAVVGVSSGWALLFAPRLIAGSLPGRAVLVGLSILQLALLAMLAVGMADSADPKLGIEAGELAIEFCFAAVAVLVLTGCGRAIAATGADERAQRRRRTVSRTGLMAAAALIALGAGAAIATGTDLRCTTFSFDADRWRTSDDAIGTQSDRERIAETLVECDTLIGRTRGELREMLGDGGDKKRGQHFLVGNVNDAIGPGDAGYLLVRLDRHGRVSRASFSYAD